MIPYSGQSRGVFSKLAQGGESSLNQELSELYLNDLNQRRLKVVQRLTTGCRKCWQPDWMPLLMLFGLKF